MTDDGLALHELGLCAAARAIRNGDVSSEEYAGMLLQRARAQAHLNAFITISEESVLEAARDADRERRNGRAAPLLGVPLAVKDSYLTRGLRTTLGTSVLAAFTPTYDAAAVAAIKEAGGIIFGKNNLVEMSYGLTGLNDHYGQVKNPYDTRHITGGSSSGAGASVAGHIVPAAFGGDTIGSIRVPASLCGVVGYRPTPGRWSSDGVAPISETLDTTGLLTRNVEDCDLVDAVLTNSRTHSSNGVSDLKGVRLAYARQHLVDVDEQVETTFGGALRELKQAGAELLEVDLGADFHALSARTTWPIFFHETLPAVQEFLTTNQVPVTFEQIYEGLGEHISRSWSGSVIPSSAGYISDEAYQFARNTSRDELRRRFATAFRQADALLFPTTPCGAPRIESQWKFRVGSKEVADVFLSRNTHATSAAGLPGITLPMGLNSEGLPLGLEVDAAAGRDRYLLGVARAIEQVIGPLAVPKGL